MRNARVHFLLWTMRCVVVACVALMLWVPGCGSNRIPIAGSYYLEKFPENGLFYLRKRGDDSVGGVFDGHVLQIGANECVVVAYVRRLYRGDPDGWYVLQVPRAKVFGPLSASELQTICRAHDITCEPVERFYKEKKSLR